MEKEDLFRKELSELLEKHSALLGIEYWNENLVLFFDIENVSVGNELITTAKRFEQMNCKGIVK